jgi:hypothetical protein
MEINRVKFFCCYKFDVILARLEGRHFGMPLNGELH